MFLSVQINLPDGRVQVVNYASDKDGFRADVTYEGTPVFPDPPPGGYGPYKGPGRQRRRRQLFQTPGSRRTDSGFQPIIGRQAQPALPALPTPGQLLITLDSVTQGQGGFRAQSRHDNFANNVQASFPTNKKRRVRIQ